MNKTISDLNNKVWYRLLKVTYIFSFLVFCILTVLLTFSWNYKSYDVVDRQNTKIHCLLGNNRQFSQKEIFGEEDIAHFRPILGGGRPMPISDPPMWSKQEEKILQFCEISNNEIMNRSKQSLLNKTVFSPYEFNIQYTSISGNIATALIYSIISLMTIVLVFEAMRRTFYYVILGTFKPKKE